VVREKLGRGRERERKREKVERFSPFWRESALQRVWRESLFLPISLQLGGLVDYLMFCMFLQN
jgi:hypothetical protein